MTAYSEEVGLYWSKQQEEVRPTCIFVPSSEKEVSVLVLLSQYTGCSFAVKSGGGHAAFAGASSSPGGITVLLKDLNRIQLNVNRSVVSVGPGNTWEMVYTALEPYELAVVGGRAATVGVGGLVLGGGISFYSNGYGLALDNVESFEVVLASGAIVTVSETSHADLYWALRGGGNNFGIVTQFNLYTIPSSRLRGRSRIFHASQSTKVINAFVTVANNAAADPKAQHYIALVKGLGLGFVYAELAYIADVKDPEILKPYRSVFALRDTTASRTVAGYSRYIGSFSPPGSREVYWTVSVQLNEELCNWLAEYYFSRLGEIAKVKGALPALVYHAVTQPVLQKMSRAGGNALGLDPSMGPLMIIQLCCWWERAEDDETVYRFVNGIMEGVTAQAKKMGVDREYIYMNYASQFQDVISGYGGVNKRRLIEVAAKYDPDGVYQTLQPGYFKLGRAPVPNPYV